VTAVSGGEDQAEGQVLNITMAGHAVTYGVPDPAPGRMTLGVPVPMTPEDDDAA
jgi:hypothetical protein